MPRTPSETARRRVCRRVANLRAAQLVDRVAVMPVRTEKRKRANSSDKAFRALLREKGAAEALIRERFDRRTIRQLIGRPQILPGSFVDQTLREHVTDVLVRIRLKGRRAAYVYFLLEHKRVAGRAVMFQLLRYLSAVYEHLARVHRGLVPCVLPLIVYNGTTRWTAPRRFLDLIEPQGRPRTGALDFKVRLLDLGATPTTALSTHRGLRGGLLGLKVAATPPARQSVVIAEALQTLEDASTRQRFLKYILTVADRAAVAKAIEAIEAVEEEKMESWAEYQERKGRRRGRAEGRVEGRVEGRTEALRDMTRELLRKRFGHVSSAVSHKLTAAGEQTLTRWFSRAISARSLAAVFKAEKAKRQPKTGS